ncbi:MAG: hypothetical protein LC802_22585 [Acidobacteria bacterium]|nr:hypothetical protein [Acidobacteriota bacterium]
MPRIAPPVVSFMTLLSALFVTQTFVPSKATLPGPSPTATLPAWAAAAAGSASSAANRHTA